MPLTGTQHLSKGGDLIIPNKLNLEALIALEKEIGKEQIIYLVEERCIPCDEIAQYIDKSGCEGILFSASESQLIPLRASIDEKLQLGKKVIYLPGQVTAIKGSLCDIPENVMNALSGLHLAPVPLFVEFYSNQIFNAQTPDRHQSTTQIHLLPKLSSGPGMPAKLGQAWLECSADVFAKLPQLQTTLAHLLIQSLKTHANCRLIDGIDDTSITFHEIFAASLAFSRRLKELSTNKRIGIILPPGKGATIANIACILAGKVPVNFSYVTSEHAFKSAVRQADVDRFITADTFMRKMQNFPWPFQRDIIFIERELPKLKGAIKRWWVLSKLMPANFINKLFLKLDHISPSDEAVLMFTSGSAGEPKGVPLTHHNIIANISQCSSRITLAPNCRFLGSLPIFHSFGMTIGLWYPLLAGCDLVTYPSPIESKSLGNLIKQYHINLVVSTPTFLRGYLKRCEADTFKSVDYLIVGAEKLPMDLSDTFQAKFGVTPCEGYGMTEASPVCSVNFIDPTPKVANQPIIHGMLRGSVGALLPGIAVRITNPHTGKDEPMSSTGMIWLKGANIFQGYLGEQDFKHELFENGWMKTGDIGSVTPYGFITIEGRISRFSKMGGEMVPHEALENAIVKILGLDPTSEERHVAIVTIPDPVKGEATALLTTVVTQYLAQASTLIRHGLTDLKLPALWNPKVIIPVEKIPVLPSGKLNLKECKMLAYEALNIPFKE